MGEHARLSPSNTRWPNCPGSVREEEKYSDKSSEASIDGTGSHVLLEMVLKAPRKPGGSFSPVSDFIGQTIGKGHEDKPEGWVVDKYRANRVQIAVDYIGERIDEISEIHGPVNISVEVKVNPGKPFGRSDWWGTCDVTLWTADGFFLEVIDYKDGFIYVHEFTSQLVGYAHGMKYLVDPQNVPSDSEKIRKTIIQPKVSNPIRFIEGSAKENFMFAHELYLAAKKTDAADAPLIAGDHCRWCCHKLNCNARNQIAVAAINGPVCPADMSPEQLASANDAVPMISSLIESIEKETFQRIDSGVYVPGYTVTSGRPPHPVWKDDEEAMDTLKGMRMKEKERGNLKVITPTAALKLPLTPRRKKSLELLIVRKEGKKKLKRVSNRKPTKEEMFGELKSPKEDCEIIESEYKPVDSEDLSQNVQKEESDLPVESVETVEGLTVERLGETEEIVARKLKMTEEAGGLTSEDFKQHDPNWTDELLVREGYAEWEE